MKSFIFITINLLLNLLPAHSQDGADTVFRIKGAIGYGTFRSINDTEEISRKARIYTNVVEDYIRENYDLDYEVMFVFQLYEHSTLMPSNYYFPSFSNGDILYAGRDRSCFRRWWKPWYRFKRKGLKKEGLVIRIFSCMPDLKELLALTDYCINNENLVRTQQTKVNLGSEGRFISLDTALTFRVLDSLNETNRFREYPLRPFNCCPVAENKLDSTIIYHMKGGKFSFFPYDRPDSILFETDDVLAFRKISDREFIVFETGNRFWYIDLERKMVSQHDLAISSDDKLAPDKIPIILLTKDEEQKENINIELTNDRVYYGDKSEWVFNTKTLEVVRSQEE